MLLAQCADPANCDIPRALPWYFALAMFAVWVAMVAGIVVLVYLLLRARAGRRPRRRLSDSTEVVPARRLE
ncbi:MAG TPA: hypothetical protein VM264_10315 [Acidimicrobiales bacterium]|nr:hypothetical protein [Acidimicrobiales bacterium]